MDECIVAMGINGREFLEDTMLNLVKDISIRGSICNHDVTIFRCCGAQQYGTMACI